MPRADLLEATALLARKAGEAIMELYRQDLAITQKDDDSPVTAADFAAHHCILEGLAALTPDIPVVSEEGEIPSAAERADWRQYWLVDPLDGTREFIARNGEFTVNIALIEDGRPVLGVVDAPALGTLYAGLDGGIAWREKAGVRTSLRTRSWPAQPSLLLSRAHPDPEAASRLERIGDYDTLQVGSSLKYCRIAEGLADVYPKFSRIWFWDTAAGQCVLEQAGGVALSLDGFAPLRYPPDSDLRTPSFVAAGDASRDWGRLLRP